MFGVVAAPPTIFLQYLSTFGRAKIVRAANWKDFTHPTSVLLRNNFITARRNFCPCDVALYVVAAKVYVNVVVAAANVYVDSVPNV